MRGTLISVLKRLGRTICRTPREWRELGTTESGSGSLVAERDRLRLSRCDEGRRAERKEEW